MQKYRLIIVDDEYLVRKGLRETINWNSLNIEIVGEYSNGKFALEAVNNLKPDLIISDIRMPVMDGLEFAAILSKQKFDGAIIYYSGYSDFEYVRKALEYGVSGYVLKPIENEQLVEKVKEVLTVLEKNRRNKLALHRMEQNVPYVVEMFFHKLLDGELEQRILSQMQFLNVKIPQSGTAIFCMVLENNDKTLSNVYAKLKTALENFGVLGYESEKEFIILTGLKDKNVIKNFVDNLLNEQSKHSACRLSVGISDEYNGVESLPKRAAQAKKLALSFAFPNVHNVKLQTPTGDFGNKNKLIDELLTLISENYSQKITVTWAAKKLFVSESHLMHETKEVLNKTFNDLLREYRILKAKQMLSKGDLRVGEVATAVGFSDVRYFTKIFKDTVGCSPAEYMKK
ncbi:MAG: response regulator [Clostridia bacterium]|nr:response regulator [Clostridia bacterium]